MRDGMEFASQYGARPIQKASQGYPKDTMSEAIMKDFIKEEGEVSVLMADPKRCRELNCLSRDKMWYKITR